MEKPDFGLDKGVHNIIESHNLALFCDQPGEINCSWVREFYMHVSDPDNPCVFMHGRAVFLNANTINIHYGVFLDNDEHAEFGKNITPKEMNKIFKELTIERATWNEGKMKGTVNRVLLKLEAK
ncbi:hypothetical protein HRI_000151900 [Hibiscus trionum]|uniref:Uncharacterized protein n=1 Tax=Hibiscus trionum TaxID=183268 RepID=A0A9W7GVH9_HIBTR|nr:hypothetical protein HRI_000151900 [Hibiscus trionum]